MSPMGRGPEDESPKEFLLFPLPVGKKMSKASHDPVLADYSLLDSETAKEK